jgi:hypothetical protein
MKSTAEIAAMIAELTPVCRKAGIALLKMEDVELHFGPAPPDPEEFKALVEHLERDIPSEEDILMHSAPGYVPVNERKQ